MPSPEPGGPAVHRRALLELLRDYLLRNAEEAATVSRVIALVQGHSNCFERTCWAGHITASAWILSPDHGSFLLTHHRKLGRWLQLGGHADGDPDVRSVALREAREESGLQHFDFISPERAAILPLDLDIHPIPARKDEPVHEHHDVRFLLIARPGQDVMISEESHDLAWFPRNASGMVASEESLARLARKADALLAGGSFHVHGPIQ